MWSYNVELCELYSHMLYNRVIASYNFRFLFLPYEKSYPFNYTMNSTHLDILQLYDIHPIKTKYSVTWEKEFYYVD